jgi:hypothetical protein
MTVSLYSLLLCIITVVTAAPTDTPSKATTVQPNISFATIAKFAGSSYCEQIFEKRVFECGWSCSGETAGSVFAESSFDQLTTGAGIVVHNAALKTIIVSFRGSDSPVDFIVNAKFWKSIADWKYSLQEFLPKNDNLLPNDLSVHAGFEMQYVRVRNRLTNATLTLANQFPDYQIIFTGHSLGGALATLAAVDFYDRYGFGDRISLYTYGAPRVGDEKWARYVNTLPFASKMYRIQRRGDPVVHLPPTWVGYEHSLQQYSILDNRSVIKCENKQGTGEPSACLNDWLSIRPAKHMDYYGMDVGRC